jgi:hypothetical protein
LFNCQYVKEPFKLLVAGYLLLVELINLQLATCN